MTAETSTAQPQRLVCFGMILLFFIAFFHSSEDSPTHTRFPHHQHNLSNTVTSRSAVSTIVNYDSPDFGTAPLLDLPAKHITSPHRLQINQPPRYANDANANVQDTSSANSGISGNSTNPPSVLSVKSSEQLATQVLTITHSTSPLSQTHAQSAAHSVSSPSPSPPASPALLNLPRVKSLTTSLNPAGNQLSRLFNRGLFDWLACLSAMTSCVRFLFISPGFCVLHPWFVCLSRKVRMMRVHRRLLDSAHTHPGTHCRRCHNMLHNRYVLAVQLVRLPNPLSRIGFCLACGSLGTTSAFLPLDSSANHPSPWVMADSLLTAHSIRCLSNQTQSLPRTHSLWLQTPELFLEFLEKNLVP